MKIRRSFVANSSTTSFTIYGAEINGKIFPDLDDEQIEDLVGNIASKTVEIHYGQEHERYIGISYIKIKDDETGKEFKNRVEEAAKKVIGKAGGKANVLKFTSIAEAYGNY